MLYQQITFGTTQISKQIIFLGYNNNQLTVKLRVQTKAAMLQKRTKTHPKKVCFFAL